MITDVCPICGKEYEADPATTCCPGCDGPRRRSEEARARKRVDALMSKRFLMVESMQDVGRLTIEGVSLQELAEALSPLLRPSKGKPT